MSSNNLTTIPIDLMKLTKCEIRCFGNYNLVISSKLQQFLDDKQKYFEKQRTVNFEKQLTQYRDQLQKKLFNSYDYDDDVDYDFDVCYDY